MKRAKALLFFLFILIAGCGGGGGGDEKTTPMADAEELLPWASVSAGGSHVVALKPDGALFVWGDNSRGQLGIGSYENVYAPRYLGRKQWEMVSAGDLHTFGIVKHMSAYAWGYKFDGQIMDLDTQGSMRNTPGKVDSSNDYKVVSAGYCHTVVLKDDGTMWMCGVYWSDEDGNVYRNRDLTKLGNQTNWTVIQAGGYLNLAKNSEGKLFAWGNNDYGQLGNDSSTHEIAPVPVFGNDADWSDHFSAGGYHSMAIKNNGSLWGWGRNDSGQLGTLDTFDRHVPSPVDAGYQYKYVSAGQSHTLAIRTDGTLWAWGSNDSGQLGNESYTSTNYPVQVTGYSDWIMVSAGWSYSVGIRSDGSMWVWGSNSSGQLGLGSSSISSVNKPYPLNVQ